MFCFCKNQRLQPEKADDGRKRSGSITATSAAEKGGREELRTERGKNHLKPRKCQKKGSASKQKYDKQNRKCQKTRTKNKISCGEKRKRTTKERRGQRKR